MADPKGKPNKPKAEAFKDVSVGEDGVYRVTEAEAGSAKAAAPAQTAGAKPDENAASKPVETPVGAKPVEAAASAAASGAKPTPAAASAASSSSPASAGAASGGGSGSGSGGGVKTALTAGAALAAGALLAFWAGPKLSGEEATAQRVDALSQRVALFDTQANALNEAAGRVDALDARVESMAGGLGAVETALAAQPQTDETGPRVAALAERLEGLEKALAELTAQQAAVVEAVNAAPAAAPPADAEAAAAATAAREAAQARVAALESGLAAVQAALPDPAAAEAQAQAQEARLEELDARFAALVEAPPVLPAEAEARLKALEARFDAIADEIADAFANGAGEGGEAVAAAPSPETLRAASDAAAALSGVQGLEARLGAFDPAALQNDLSAIRARLETAEAPVEIPPAATPEDLAALAAQVAGFAALPGRLDDLAAKLEADAAAPPPVTAADLEVFAVRDELADLPTRADLEAYVTREDLRVDLADAPSRAEYDALLVRLDQAEERLAAATAVRTEAAAAVAAADLQNVASGSAPFANQLANLQRLSGVKVDPQLEIYARTGAPTMASLLGGFNEAERAALRAEEEARARAAQDLGSKATAALSSLISVRRAAESAGVDTASILARARARLNEGDLASALAELETLQSEPRAGMALWLKGAQDRRYVEESLGRLRQDLLTAPGPQQ